MVLFIDGHCEIPDPFLLVNLAELFGRTSADIICRPQPLDATGIDNFQKAVAIARASPLGHNPSSFIFSTKEDGFVNPDSSGAAYTRRVFEQIGYYDESFDACEDVDFNLRARKSGLRAYTSPRVTVRYFPRETLGSLFRQMMRYGRGCARLFMRHPRDAFTGAVLLGVPLVISVALALLSPFYGLAGLFLLSLACGYVIFVALGSFLLSRQTGSVGLTSAIFFSLMTIHLGS